jgi:hypothetical protein
VSKIDCDILIASSFLPLALPVLVPSHFGSCEYKFTRVEARIGGETRLRCGLET